MSYIYIASPYTHTDPDIMEARYRVVAGYTTSMFQREELCFSPIVHCHPLALIGNLPRDIDYWHLYSRVMVSHSSEVHMLHLPGWETSKGCQLECDFATEIGLPITHVSMDGIYSMIEHHPGMTELYGSLIG